MFRGTFETEWERRQMGIRSRQLVRLVLLSSLAAACSSSSTSQNEPDEDTLALETEADVPELDVEPVDLTETVVAGEDSAPDLPPPDTAPQDSLDTVLSDEAADREADAVADEGVPEDSDESSELVDTQLDDPAEDPDLVPDVLRIDEWLARCPSAAELDAVDDALLLSFEDDPTAGELVCLASEGSRDLTQLQKRGYQAVLLMTLLTFDEPLPWTDQSLGEWFSGAITGIRFREGITHNSCCSPANTINIKIQSAWLDTDLWIKPSNGAGVQGLVAVMIHEARHNESKPHNCGSYDTDLAFMGAWAVEYYFLWWVAYHADPCLIRQTTGGSYYGTMARAAANSILSTRFCDEDTPPSDSPPALPVCTE